MNNGPIDVLVPECQLSGGGTRLHGSPRAATMDVNGRKRDLVPVRKALLDITTSPYVITGIAVMLLNTYIEEKQQGSAALHIIARTRRGRRN